jgi:hypothetical protein
MKSRELRLPSPPMLTHFTRASKTASAMDNLLAIIEQGVVRGARRMIRGTRPVVSLFDAPFAELRTLLNRQNRRRYEPFGIAINKRYAFRNGARPVIYLPWREAKELLPPAELWRVVTIEIGTEMAMDRTPAVDWTHEREWRVAGDLALESRYFSALVANWRDADVIFDHFGGHPPCAGVIPLDAVFGRSV